MSNDERMTKRGLRFAILSFENSDFLRHSSFVLRHFSTRGPSQMKPIMLTGEYDAVHDDLRCSDKCDDNCEDRKGESLGTKAATNALKPRNIYQGKGDQSPAH